jgi:hypothetical protein
MTSDVSFRIRNTNASAAVVKRLRTAVATPVLDLAKAIETHTPFVVRHLYGGDHDEAENALLTLLHDLDAMGVEVEILVAGETVSKQYLLNILQRYRDIRHDVAMESELESGHPSAEALRWARGERPGEK